jgi:predicted nuclease with RNAse H fold
MKKKTGSRSKSTVKTSVKKSSRRIKSAETSASIDRLLETGGTVTHPFQLIRFAGVALGGGKTDKTAVAVLEFYPDQKRVFLRSLRERVSSKGEMTADHALLEVLTNDEKDLSTIAFDAPLQLPVCMRCDEKCPPLDTCKHPTVKWMQEMHKKRAKHKRPNKMFTPYTERAAEIYIANELEEAFHPSHALGANAAPLTARALYLAKRLKTPLIEVYPKLSLWRIGTALGIQKSYLRHHKHAVDSDEARLHILKALIDKEIAFIYQQDLRSMVENNVAFEAFIGAITAFLKFRGQTEKRPVNFPKDEIWIDFPREKIQWF